MYAIITGASSGIGREMAILLAQKNYSLILVARRKDRLEQLKEQLQKQYAIEVKVAVYDLSNRQSCLDFCQKYRNYPVEILINNAGFGKIGYVTDTPLEEQLSIIDTNIIAVHILSKEFAKRMKKGYILNVASIAAFQPSPFLSTYGATKSYVAKFSMALGYEFKKQRKHISVTTLCPGPVSTEFDLVAGTDFSLSAITAKECAIEGLNGMFKKKRLVLPKTAKLAYIGVKFLPLNIVIPIVHKIQKGKTKKKL